MLRPPILRRAIAAAVLLSSVVGGTRGEEPPPLGARRPPRAERSEAERRAEAARLRRAYAGPAAGWPPPHVDPGVEWRELGLLPEAVHPADNPFTPAKAELGRLLFHDTRLSASGRLACVSCHAPHLGWADGRRTSEPAGPRPGRNAPTIRNVAFQHELFWDGRATSLEAQAVEALTNPHEMAATREHVVQVMLDSPSYRDRFAAAFPDRPVDFAGATEAIACYERTVVGGESPFDAFLRGDPAALPDAAVLGLDLFRREGRCLTCHHGPTLSDGKFHDLGLSFYRRSNEDLGRSAVTGLAADRGRFRTPSLRDVTTTEPLMHTGTFRLPGVLAMYNAGMVTLKRDAHERNDPNFPAKSRHLRPLGLNRQDLADLAAFLESLAEPPLESPAQPSLAGEPSAAPR